MQTETSFLEWWHLMSEKRCDDYAHSHEDEYNEALKAFSQLTSMSKPYTSKNLTLGDEAPKFMWDPLG